MKLVLVGIEIYDAAISWPAWSYGSYCGEVASDLTAVLVYGLYLQWLEDSNL